MRSLVAIAQRAHELAQPVGGLPVLVATFYRATGLLAVGEAPRAEPLLEGLLPLVDDDAVAGSWLPATVGYLLLFFERHEQAQGLLQRVVRRARQTGMLEVLPYALATLAHTQLRCGEGLAAYAHATESVTLAEDTGQSGELANSLFVLTLVHAVRGDTSGRESAARSLELADRFGIGSMGVMTRAAWGLLELGLGHVDAAIDQLEYARRRAAEAEVIEPAIARWAPDLIEAYVYAHRLEDARSELAAFEQVARRTARIGALAAAARCRGLCASPRQYDASFQHALTLHAQVADPFERARTELCFGERLRRAKRRSEARRWLDQALGTFERLGARPWAERTRRELAATGERARPRREPATDGLTPQELQVALTVAAGATNREAAASLFVSPKTIETHLGRVFRKLGVRSRTELAIRLRDEAETQTPPRAPVAPR
jgi:DNA-binding CsgD family transcriptional regulator